MADKIYVHIQQGFDDDWIDSLRDLLSDNIELTSGEIAEAARYHILVWGRPSAEALTASPNLHALVIPWAGVPDVTRELMLDYPAVKVYNLHHNALPVAEHAFALMIAAAKNIVPNDQALRQNDWRPRYTEDAMSILHGKTALILGYGAIGRKISAYCRAFGMTVRGIRNKVQNPVDGDVEIYPRDKLLELLPQADVLFVSLPLTPQTENLLGAHELSLLPDRAIVINIGRGKIIHEHSLYAALRLGRIRAGLDVWYQYPRDEDERIYTSPSKYPFHELDNAVLSPHTADQSEITEKLRLEHLADLLNTIASGNEPSSRISLEQGY